MRGWRRTTPIMDPRARLYILCRTWCLRSSFCYNCCWQLTPVVRARRYTTIICMWATNHRFDCLLSWRLYHLARVAKSLHRRCSPYRRGQRSKKFKVSTAAINSAAFRPTFDWILCVLVFFRRMLAFRVVSVSAALRHRQRCTPFVDLGTQTGDIW